MKIETIGVSDFYPAFYAMRSPFSSWQKSDSVRVPYQEGWSHLEIGPADLALSQRLQKAGPEHCKHLRMIVVWANVSISLKQWAQVDTYRAGVEKVSTSTMHTMMKRELTTDDFEPTSDGKYSEHMLATIAYLNKQIRAYAETDDPETKRYLWEYTIQALPESFLQQRTVMFSYAALRNIVRQRKGHKLKSWASFIDWVHTLPYADELIFDGDGNNDHD